MTLLLLFLVTHGVNYYELNEARVFRVIYDDGTPLSYALVEVISQEGNVVQKIEADSLGVFTFVPQKDGKWTLRVSDGMGHGTKIIIDERGEIKGKAATDFLKPYQKAIIGASLIWGIAGTLFFFFTRRRDAHT